MLPCRKECRSKVSASIRFLNHPGWDNDRHCTNGLWDYADDEGNRQIYKPLAAELQLQQERFQAGAPATADPAEPEHQLAWSMGIDREA